MPHYFSFSSHTWRCCSSLLGILSLGITLPLSGQANRTVVVRGLNYAFQAPDTVPAGLTTFILDNQGTVRHEVVVVRLKEGHTLSEVIAAKTLEERQPLYEDVVGLIVAKPGQRAPGSLVTKLVKGGNYVLLCNLRDAPDKPTHLMQGMGRVLHVR
jgi:hypothetical protein